MRRPSFGTIVLVWLAAVIFFTPPASMQGPGRSDRELVNGREVAAREALVRFRDPVGPPDLADLHARADSDRLEQIGGTGVLHVRSRSMNAATLVARLAQHPNVLYAEPNYIVRTFSTPSDINFPQLWGLENLGQSVNGGLPGTFGSDIRAVQAWNISVGSTAHVVGVIDTGIDYTHPDLAPNIWSAPAAFAVDLGGGTIVNCAAGTHGFNAITRTCNPLDDHGHGTHVAGTIGAAGNNGLGVVGVNWTTRLMGIKILDAGGSGTIADAIAAIRFAIAAKRAFPGAADVRILSASWGGFDFSQALADEIAAVQSEDMLFVAAAGNNGLNNDIFPIYPASFSAPNIVSVAATTNTNSRAYFSNYGPTTVHLGAPGVDILSTMRGHTYSYASGTSMAAPHVSGAAALVLSRCAFDTAVLKDALIGTVQPMAALESSTITGGGLDVHSAIHSCVAPPPAPTLSAVGGDSQARLSWNGALGATGYTVKRSLVSGGPYTAIASGVKGARYTDSTVANGTPYFYVVSATNLLGESADSNEASATPNAPSDLVVSALTAPSNAGAGATIAVAVTTLNQGGGPATATTTRLYLSANAILDGGDVALEPSHAVPALVNGATISASLSVTIPHDTPTGTRYLFAVADADRVADETSEYNNTRMRSLAVGPDLTVSALTVPAMAAAGEVITVTDTVKNQGASAAPSSTTSFYLSVNALLDAGDTLLAGTRAVPALAAGASNSGTSAVIIPAGTAVGTYYLFAKADGGNAIVEASELNNTSVKTVRIGGDLRVSALSAPAAAGPASSIVISDTTTNHGGGPIGQTTTTYYFSTTASLGAQAVSLGGRPVPSLAAGAGHTGAATVTIPSDATAGTYYIIAKSDGNDVAAETVETNNTLSRSIQVGGDLRVSVFSAPTKGGAGLAIVVSDTTVNQGTGGVAVSATRFYLSSNALLDAGDTMFPTGRAVPALAAGATSSGSTTLVVPAGVGSGTYYLIAKADGDNTVEETLETNNTSLRSISIGPDLVVSSLAVPGEAAAGSIISVTDTTANQGGGGVPPSATAFFLSTNFTLDAGDTALDGTRDVGTLAPGASSSGATTLTIPSGTVSGLYYIIAKADGGSAVVETQEANNMRAISIRIGADLAVSYASLLTSTIQAGSTASVSTTVVNQGTGLAAPSTLRFYLSLNGTLDASDLLVEGSRDVPALATDATSLGATVITIPAGTSAGTYYLLAKADADGVVTETNETNNVRIVRSINVTTQ